MARFDLFTTSSGSLVASCQSDLFDHLDVRFVMPLVPVEEAPRAASRLNPKVEVDGEQYLAFPQWSSGMPVRELDRHGGNLEADGYRLLDALDMLISGI